MEEATQLDVERIMAEELKRLKRKPSGDEVQRELGEIAKVIQRSLGADQSDLDMGPLKDLSRIREESVWI